VIPPTLRQLLGDGEIRWRGRPPSPPKLEQTRIPTCAGSHTLRTLSSGLATSRTFFIYVKAGTRQSHCDVRKTRVHRMGAERLKNKTSRHRSDGRPNHQNRKGRRTTTHKFTPLKRDKSRCGTKRRSRKSTPRQNPSPAEGKSCCPVKGTRSLDCACRQNVVPNPLRGHAPRRQNFEIRVSAAITPSPSCTKR